MDILRAYNSNLSFILGNDGQSPLGSYIYFISIHFKHDNQRIVILNEVYMDIRILNEVYMDIRISNEVYMDIRILNEVYMDIRILNEVYMDIRIAFDTDSSFVKGDDSELPLEPSVCFFSIQRLKLLIHFIS